jgi:eukaryotic-like serine/threonine-protein kinase
MKPEQWKEVERLYHAALERAPAERAAFLDKACDSDPTVRQEVESLLAYDERAAHFITTRLDKLAAEMLAEVPAVTPPDRIRVALVAGPGLQQPSEFYGFLLRRLRIFSLMMAGGLAVLIGLLLWDLVGAIQAGVIEELGGYSFVRFVLINLGIPLAVSALSALLLWWRPPASLGGLRAIELLITGTVAAVILWDMAYAEWYGLLEQTSAQESPRNLRAFRGAYVESTSLRWFCLLVGYSALIPNTWRRCAAVVSALALSPLVMFAVFSFWVRPLETGVAIRVLTGLAFWIGVAAGIVVFASYRIEVLRQQVAKARKLGQYLLKERLGAGGMGEVYLAEHILLRRPCALKLIRPERAGDPEHLRRFEREVRLTATLTHPNTVQVFDYGHAEDGTFYYVMEYLPGLTLEEIVGRHGPLPPQRAIYFLRQVCGALQEAHAIGLIHRDIKPGNVMVCERGGQHDVVKLLDFGLVLPVVGAADGEKLTQEGTIAGTPAYMSPEQAGEQENLDARSDIYSLGALAYFLLTGQPPFVCSSAVRTLAAHLYETPAPLTQNRPDVPGDLEAVVLRCLAKHPADRFPDAESLEEALAACRTAGQWSAQEAATWWRSNQPQTTAT